VETSVVGLLGGTLVGAPENAENFNEISWFQDFPAFAGRRVADRRALGR